MPIKLRRNKEVEAPSKSKTTKKKSSRKGSSAKTGKVPPKAKASKPKEKVNPIDQWVEEQNKKQKYKGKAQIRMANQVRSPYVLRRPTGVLGLDLALGGGLHAGGSIELHGKQSVGKTYMAFHAAGALQEIYKEDTAIIIYSTEIRPDKGFARRAGFCIAYSSYEIEEMNEVRFDSGLNPFTPEEIIDLEFRIGRIVVITSDTAETGFNVLIDALRFGGFQLMIVESLGALLTKAQDEKDVGERTVAGPSVAVTHWQNKSYPLFMMDDPDGNLRETTVLGINQARANVGSSSRFKDSKSAMGAYSWKHAQLASILLKQGEGIRETENGPVIGREIRWVLEKGKAGTRDGLKGKYMYYHQPISQPVFWRDVSENWYGGIAVFNEAVEAASEAGVIEQSGAWYNWQPPLDMPPLKAQGANNMAHKLAGHSELMSLLRQECLKKKGILVRYK